MAKRIELNVNGKTHTIEAEPDMPLLYALRDDLGLSNPRFGCGLAQCGACTVLINGVPVRSCATPVDSVGDKKITTLNGIGTAEKPHKVQAAFIEEQVPQCGYCLNGWVMTSVALLEKNPAADRRPDPRGARRHQVPLRHPHRDPARRQARGAGLREAAMNMNINRRELLAGAGALVVSVALPGVKARAATSTLDSAPPAQGRPARDLHQHQRRTAARSAGSARSTWARAPISAGSR